MQLIQSDVPSWEETFFRDVYNYARRSKDPRTKISAVLVDWNLKVAISHSYNGFARNVVESEARWQRPLKYEFVIHGEANILIDCARRGISTQDKVLFTNGVPCVNCSKLICNSGIREVVVHKQWMDYEVKFNREKWLTSAELSKQMFIETGVELSVFDKVLGVKGFLDGKEIDV